MDELVFIYGTVGVILAYFLAQVVTRRFDPFAPVWLFLVGYVHVYIIQALSYSEGGVGVGGKALVAAATWGGLGPLAWFLAFSPRGMGGRLAGVLPGPRGGWSPPFVPALSPPLILWGLYCSG